MNVVVAVLCGLGLLTAQYFVGRGPYPFLALPGYAVLALAALVSIGCLGKTGTGPTKWACVFFSAALAAWVAAPLLERMDEWIPGLIVRQVLAAMVVYGLVVFCITGSRERLVLLALLLAGAFAQAALGFFQYLAPDAKLHLGWVTTLCPDHMELHTFRARGLFYNANHLAWLLNISGAFSLAVGVWGGTRLWARLALLYAAAVFFGLGILTQSRGGLIGMFAALGVFFALGCRSMLAGAMGRRGRTFGLLLLSLSAVIGAAWLAFSSSDLAQYRVFTATEEGYRVNVWKTALRLWQTEPIVGAGAGTFTNASRQLRLQTEAIDDICAHNDWVQGLAELGLIGAGLGLCVVILHFAAGWREFGSASRRKSRGEGGGLRRAVQVGALASLAACAAHSFFDFNMQVPANMLLLALVLGFLAAPGGGAPSGGFSKAFRKAGLVSTAALGVALALTVWQSHRAELAWILADKALRFGDYETAVETAAGGLTQNPAHARLADTAGRAAHALFLKSAAGSPERASNQTAMLEFFKKTVDLEPGDAWNFLNLAHAMDTKSADGNSSGYYFEAMRIAPFYAAPYEFGGLGLETAGKRSEAIRFYGLALSLPGSTYSRERRDVLVDLEARAQSPP